MALGDSYLPPQCLSLTLERTCAYLSPMTSNSKIFGQCKVQISFYYFRTWPSYYKCMSEPLIQYQTFVQNKQALLLPKERRFKLSSAFLVLNDGNSHLISLDYVFPALEKSPTTPALRRLNMISAIDWTGKNFEFGEKSPKLWRNSNGMAKGAPRKVRFLRKWRI